MTPMRLRLRRGSAPRTAALAAALAAALFTLLLQDALRAAAGTPGRHADPVRQFPAASPVAEHGDLAVCGRTLCDDQGRTVRLTGMSTHGTQWYAQCATAASLDVLAGEWDADVLRVSTYAQEGGYETDPEGFTRTAQRIVDLAAERGMYAVIDWHMLDPGDPHANTALAERFFADMASRYADSPHVLYEIANEPSGVSWPRIKSYAEEVIPVIRARDGDGVVLVGTRAWSSFGVSEGADEQEVVDDPVDAADVMYTFHFYAASHREEYLRTLSRAADRLPVFVTEFGTQDYAGEGANDFAMAQRYLDLMAEKDISWINWNYSDDHRSGAVFRQGTCDTGDFSGTGVLKEAGVWVRERIRAG